MTAFLSLLWQLPSFPINTLIEQWFHVSRQSQRGQSSITDMANPTSELPPSDSPNLALVNPTPEEKEATWRLNGQEWRGAMDISTYLRREAHLENQAFTKDGGITFWVLVDANLPPNARPILSTCESLRKKAVIIRENGELMVVTSHGIASVFCNPEYRGRRYTQRMLSELGKKLDVWQQNDGERASFTVLYSDIGKVWG